MDLIKKYLDLSEKSYQKFICEKMQEELKELINFSQQRLNTLVRKLEMSGFSQKEIDQEEMLVIWFTIFTSKGMKVPRTIFDYKLLYHLLYYLMQEQDEYQQKLFTISDYENKLKEIERESEFVIMNKEKEVFKVLLKQHEEACKIKLRIRLLNEAVNNIRFILETVEKFQKLVDNAKTWNNFDILSRGLLLSLTNTPEFKSTESLVKELYYRGNKLMRKLKIIGYYTNMQINYQELKELYHYIDNNLYEDLKEQESLKKAINKFQHFPTVLTNIADTLIKHKEKYLQELLSIEKHKQDLLIQVIV